MSSPFTAQPLQFEPNVRFERAGATKGYIWGKPAASSNILATLPGGSDREAAMAALGVGADDIVAERWIVSDDREHPSLARLANGALAPLGELLETHGEALLGASHAAAFGPYLRTIMKLLDTNASVSRGGLSVQVHPPPDYPGRPPKPEMWMGEGTVYLGWAIDVDEATIRDAVDGSRLERLLNEVDLGGDRLVLVPGGTVHAIRANSFLKEWSFAPGRENIEGGLPLSASTVALYDRTDGHPARPGKEDFAAAIDVIASVSGFAASTRFASVREERCRDDDDNAVTSLFRTPEVLVEHWQVMTALEPERAGHGLPLYVERGEVTLEYPGGRLELGAGDEAFVPACLAALRVVSRGPGPAQVLSWRAPVAAEREQAGRGEALTLFSRRDRAAFAARGANEADIGTQLGMFRAGSHPARLDRPCTLGDGLRTIDPAQAPGFAALWSRAQAAGRGSKFVPASGAASRMFAALTHALSALDGDTGALPPGAPPDPQLQRFLAHIESFAFSDALRAALADSGHDSGAALDAGEVATVLRGLVSAEGLDYARRAKGLIEFHRYASGPRTAVEEHLAESAAWLADADGVVRIDFTVPTLSRDAFGQHIAAARARLEVDGLRFVVRDSVQARSSETIAVDDRNEPVRSAAGDLLFRPSGHGALLDNLAALGGDVVFLKNIDNVAPAWLQPAANAYKPLLGGLLVSLQDQIHQHLRALADGACDRDGLARMLAFVRRELNTTVDPDLRAAAPERQAAFLRERLDRPLRVCGMVRNEGDPGGGPFWLANSDFPLQIVEQAQLDTGDPGQYQVWKRSTHFNPVDIVCGMRGPDGTPYALDAFRDAEAYFISRKPEQGVDVKALELPGLWNGAMAKWNTVFVEMPVTGFNPVKTVLDLLRPAHQPAAGPSR